jgi:hypothetical protein
MAAPTAPRIEPQNGCILHIRIAPQLPTPGKNTETIKRTVSLAENRNGGLPAEFVPDRFANKKSAVPLPGK